MCLFYVCRRYHSSLYYNGEVTANVNPMEVITPALLTFIVPVSHSAFAPLHTPATFHSLFLFPSCFLPTSLLSYFFNTLCCLFFLFRASSFRLVSCFIPLHYLWPKARRRSSPACVPIQLPGHVLHGWRRSGPYRPMELGASPIIRQVP